jgi:ferritin-like metal-binding protein YciE
MKKTSRKTQKEMTLHDLLILKLRALYDIEQNLVKALPKMAAKATDPELKKGFTDHLAETKNQVKRLEECFSSLGEKATKTKVEAIRGLIEDSKWLFTHVAPAESLDAALIAAASYVENYEMAGYRAALSWAKKMEHESVAALLAITLEEEVLADEKLFSLLESRVNERAYPM